MLYGYAINVMEKSIEKIDCGSGLSNLNGVRNRRRCDMREILFRGKHMHVCPENKHLDGTVDIAMSEIRYTVDAYDEYFHTGRLPERKE